MPATAVDNYVETKWIEIGLSVGLRGLDKGSRPMHIGRKTSTRPRVFPRCGMGLTPVGVGQSPAWWRGSFRA